MNAWRNIACWLSRHVSCIVAILVVLQLSPLPAVFAQGTDAEMSPASAARDCLFGPSDANRTTHLIPVVRSPEYSQNPAQKQALGKGVFLVASRSLVDPNFRKTVILLTEYGELGSMGVIINRPTSVPLAVAFPEFTMLANRPDSIYLGGPVQVNSIRLLIRADDASEDVKHVFGSVYLIDNMDTLTRLYSADPLDDALHVYAGYAGWAPGQLEREVLRGDWHIVQADAETVFDKTPNSIWPDLIKFLSGQWVMNQRNRPVQVGGPASGSPFLVTSLAK